MSISAAVAVLDVGDKPYRPPAQTRTSSPRSAVPSGEDRRSSGTVKTAARLEAEARLAPPAPVEPQPLPSPPRPAGAPVGMVRKVRVRRRRFDLVVYEGAIALVKPGSTNGQYTVGQVVGLDKQNRVIQDPAVQDVVVREDKLSGQARIKLRTGKKVVLSWWVPRHNQDVEVENLLTSAFRGRVDQGSSDIAGRFLKVALTVAVLGALVFGVSTGVGMVLANDAAPPAAVEAPAVTLPPAEQAARAQLQPACPSWLDFAQAVPAGERPAPGAMRPIVDGMRGRFDAAVAASPDYAAARDELGYLQAYARRTAADIGRESISRVVYAMDTVTAACERARG